MATKRKSPSGFSNGQGTPKKHRASPPLLSRAGDDEDGMVDVKSKAYAPLDPDFGQRGAFPGLEHGSGEDHLFYGPASDGLEYLRMVRMRRKQKYRCEELIDVVMHYRSEATTVPRVLVAPSSQGPYLDGRDEDSCNTKDEDDGGWYEDGAYIAAGPPPPSNGQQQPSDEDSDVDPQEAYYNALLSQFSSFRISLANPPPPTINKSLLGPYISIDALRHYAKQPQWEYAFQFKAPRLVDLAPASQDDVLRGLDRLAKTLRKKTMLGEVQGMNLGAWAWALLGKCRDVGDMGGDEIAVLRGLGKVALVVGYRIRQCRAGEDGEGEDGDEGGEADNEQAGDVGPGDHQDQQAKIPGEEEGQEGTDSLRNGEVQREACVSGASEQAELEGIKASLLRSLDNEGSTLSLPKGDQIPSEGVVTYDERFQRALATLDIIVTLIGEVFGQRDLLDRREAWKDPADN